MILRFIVGISSFLMVCSCFQRPSDNDRQIKDASNQQLVTKTGLRIENTPTRGLGFTDTLGTKYGLVYITTAMTNDSTIPIHLHIAFSREYDYPIAYGDEHFNIILLSKEWAMEGFEITDSMINELPKYIGKPPMNKILEPNETYVATIGILRPSRENLCSATPYALLEYGDRGNYPSCVWAMNEDQSATRLSLGLKVGFCTSGQEFKSCNIIPCGQISYPDN